MKSESQDDIILLATLGRCGSRAVNWAQAPINGLARMKVINDIKSCYILGYFPKY